MSNFQGRDLELAGHLLESFTFVSSGMTRALFESAFHQLSSYNHLAGVGRRDAIWANFIRSAVVTHVEGETPSTTDSGYLFARMAKRHLAIPEEQVVTPEQALRIFNSDSKRPIVFVDDFVGSGDQIISTWKRKYSVSSSAEFSFLESTSHITSPVYYIPLFATEAGLHEISKHCTNLIVVPTHTIAPTESAVDTKSTCWPEGIRSEGIEFIERCSVAAGIDRSKFKGYRDLGLTLAFDHGTPDATLPIFTHETDSWRPLIK